MLKIEQLSARVIRILGCNPSPLTLQGTNSYLIGTGQNRVLVDTSNADKPEYISLLKSQLKKENCQISSIIATHFHPDHVGSIPCVFREIIQNNDIQVYKIRRRLGEEADIQRNYHFIEHNHTFTTEGATLRVLFNPGHSDDHLVLYLEEENAVFSGDTILNGTTTTVKDLTEYMKSLQDILDLKPNRIYPGHGPVIEDGETRVRDYIAHRNKRETQILEYLTQNQNGSHPPIDIVKAIYIGLDTKLYNSASDNVVQHLNKLLRENKVENPEEGLWRLKSS